MIYNPKYVHFEPVNGMIDKWCIAADSVRDIKEILVKDDESITRQLVQIKTVNSDKSFPFNTTSNDSHEFYPFKFVYIDPAFQDMIHNEKGLKWTDLKIGDTVRSKENRNIRFQVQGIDESADTWEHIFFGGRWKSNDDLAADWEKVEE